MYRTKHIGMCVKSIEGRGGIQKNYLLWFRMFRKRGVEVTLYVLERTTVQEDGIIYLEGDSLERKKRSLASYLKENVYDLFLLNAEYMKPVLKMYHQSYYITVHNTWEIKGWLWKRYKQRKRLEKKYLHEKLIGISESVLDNITDVLRIPVQSKTVIYAPHDFESVRHLSTKIVLDEPLIVAVGSLIRRKNYQMLIEAYRHIENKIPHKLFIIGDGEDRSRLEKLVEQYGLTERIVFIGYEKNPYPYISQASLLVSASLSEGLPRVIVEALILHTPVVTTYASKGIDEVMIGELSEFIVKSYDSNLFAKTILKALEDYPQITEAYYQKFSEEFGYQSFLRLMQHDRG